MGQRGRRPRHRIGGRRLRPKKGELREFRQWFSLDVAARHAATQQGVDIRARLYASYDSTAKEPNGE